MTQLNKHLRFYREQRLSIIPIPYGKKEAHIKWQAYQKRLPTDAEIDVWFSDNQSNLAIVCGEVSGNLVVIDCDTDQKFFELKPIIESKLVIDNLVNNTPIVKTGNGYHIYFRTPTPVKSVKFPRLDIKGEGGYVIAPPSIHPNGTEYKFLNPDVHDIFPIVSLSDIGLDVEQKPELPHSQPNWISNALQHGVAQGERNDTCFRLAGYFKERQPRDITTQVLLSWNQKNRPPLSEKEVITAVDSAYTYAVNNNSSFDIRSDNNNSLETFQNRDKPVTTIHQKGREFAKNFDGAMRESGGPMSRRDIAVTLGLEHTSDTFRQIVKRRLDEGKIRRPRNSPTLLEWINRDYVVTPLEGGDETYLDMRLPLSLHDLVRVPQRAMVGVAGVTSAGKTAFLLEAAALNVYRQPLKVYYWYMEMSEAKFRTRREDFPKLEQAQKDGLFIPVMQGDFEFDDVIDPGAINIIDYIDRDNDVYLNGQTIRDIHKRLETGCAIFGLQKQPKSDYGYGGIVTAKLSTIYIVLDKIGEEETTLRARATIKKAKDWDSVSNPSGQSCEYHTGGEHGKLFQDGEWKRR